MTLRGEHLYRGPLGRKDGKLALAIGEIEEVKVMRIFYLPNERWK